MDLNDISDEQLAHLYHVLNIPNKTKIRISGGDYKVTNDFELWTIFRDECERRDIDPGDYFNKTPKATKNINKKEDKIDWSALTNIELKNLWHLTNRRIVDYITLDIERFGITQDHKLWEKIDNECKRRNFDPEALSDEIKISDDYTAIIMPTGTVQVGCVKVSYKILKQIAQLSKKNYNIHKESVRPVES